MTNQLAGDRPVEGGAIQLVAGPPPRAGTSPVLRIGSRIVVPYRGIPKSGIKSGNRQGTVYTSVLRSFIRIQLFVISITDWPGPF
jgi:hypothetical protein